jgi:hypothetical protein
LPAFISLAVDPPTFATVGSEAVPPKSPANCNLPFVVASASAMVASLTFVSTYVLTAN